MTALTLTQLRQHGVGHIHVVALPCAVCKAEGMHIGVLAQILQLILFVIGVYSNAYGTYLGAGIQEREPIGHILSPKTHMSALGYADCYQTAGHIIDPLIELLPCETQVTVRIYYVFPVRRYLCPMLKPIAQRFFR